MTARRLFLLLALGGSLAGCGHSPATRLLTIDVAPPSAAARPDYRGPPLLVPAVHVPPALDRVEYASEPVAGEIRIDDFAHWAAPLGVLARDALVRDLIARLPEGAVLPPGAAAGRAGARIIDVTIVALDADRGTMQAAYRFLPNGPLRQLVLTSAATPPAPDTTPSALGGPATLAALLGQLADRIALDPALAAR